MIVMIVIVVIMIVMGMVVIVMIKCRQITLLTLFQLKLSAETTMLPARRRIHRLALPCDYSEAHFPDEGFTQ